MILQFDSILQTTGSVVLSGIALYVCYWVCFLVRVYVLPDYGFHKNLKDYGDWAVVTGATDGIGKEYAKQLADHGLNVVLISRTKAKLDALAEEIRNKSKVQVEVVVYDFSNVVDYETIRLKIETLDIGVLINNVGQSYASLLPFNELEIEKVVDVMNVNMISDVRMTHLVLPGMFNRKRGAIVHIASGSVFLNSSYINVYAATKSFMKKFTDTLHLESKGIVDHQLLTPMYVESKLSNMKAGLTIPTAHQFVASALKTIGIGNEVCGYLSHELIYLAIKFVPTVITTYFYELSRLKRLKRLKIH